MDEQGLFQGICECFLVWDLSLIFFFCFFETGSFFDLVIEFTYEKKPKYNRTRALSAKLLNEYSFPSTEKKMGRNTMNAHTPRTSSYSTVGILQHPSFSRVNILFVNVKHLR